MSNSLSERIQAIINKVEMPDRHTFYQIQRFIIGKEYTVQGQLWAIIRELKARQESLQGLLFQIQELEDQLESLDIAGETLERMSTANRFGIDDKDEDLRIRQKAIDIRRNERQKLIARNQLKELQTKSMYLAEEAEYLVRSFEVLSKTEAVKPIDDLTAQKEYWNEKCAEELNLRLLLNNPLDSDLVRTILALDNDAPVKKQVLEILNKVQQHMIEDRDRKRSEAASITLEKNKK